MELFLINISFTFHLLSSFLPPGADIVGVNCHFDPKTCVETVSMMKAAVEKAGLKAHYMVQPLAYHTPDCGCQGFIDLPEFPFGKRFLLRRIYIYISRYLFSVRNNKQCHVILRIRIHSDPFVSSISPVRYFHSTLQQFFSPTRTNPPHVPHSLLSHSGSLRYPFLLRKAKREHTRKRIAYFDDQS